jgi:NADPH:quinone reductase-like Zn-dependent oxidoreductase
VRLLSAWGIRPAAVVGHSSGEIGAAFAAGILSQESCMAIAYHRGLATVNFKSRYPDLHGSMLAVGAGANEVQPLLKGLKGGRAVIACVNSPSSITVSGDEEAIRELQHRVEELHLFNRKLRVDMAYHSHHMELVAEDYLASIAEFQPRNSSRTRFFSSVTGLEAVGSDLQPSYWVKNLTSPVQFTQALHNMCLSLTELVSSQHENIILVELGPHAALEGPIKQTLKEGGGALNTVEYAPTLIRNKNAVETMQHLAATLCTRGLCLDFEAINFPRSRDKSTTSLLTDLPRYPWQHKTRYWHESRIADNHRFGRVWPRNDILGALAEDSNDLEPRWRNIIRLEDMPWLRDHQIQSKIVFPMAGYVTMAMEAASQRAMTRHIKFDKFEFREISANRALILEESAEVETMITLRPYNEGTKRSTDSWDEFRVFAWAADKGWVEHCRGMVGVQKDNSINAVDGQRQMETARELVRCQSTMMDEKCTEVIDIDKLSANLQSVGVYYGPAFQGFLECRTAKKLAVAEVEIANTAAMMPKFFEPELIMHPATLDLIIQILWPVLGAGRTGWDKIYMPSGFKRLSISANVAKIPGTRLRVYGTSPEILPMVAKAVDLDVFATEKSNPDSACVILEGYTVTPVHHDVTSLSRDDRDLCFKINWEPFKENETALRSKLLEMDTVIICDDLPTEFPLSKLQHSLEVLTGRAPVTTPLKQVQPEGNIYIVLSELNEPLLANLNPEGFASIQQLFTTAKGILWVVQGAYQESDFPNGNMATGLARTIRSETELKFATVDLDSRRTSSVPDASEVITKAFRSIFSPFSSGDDCEMEFMERNGILHIPKVVVDDEMNNFIHQQFHESKPELQPFFQTDRPLKMKIGSPGLLDTLHFIDDYTLSSTLPEGHVEIEVKAVGLNFKDVMIAMGQLVNEHIGVECAGVVTRVGSAVLDLEVGDRVCAISEGSFASYVRCRATSVARIEDSLSFETGSTIPLIWTTAYYSLIHVGRLEKGESVLIHAAAGGVGQAAIILAQMIGAEIFVTVGSLDKKNFLMNEYKISEDRIFFSRDTSFASQIKTATKGQGVDVVLNSLAGDALLATWQCLASFGRFVEIGKRDIVSNTRLEMAPFAKNVTFSSVDLIVVVSERPLLMKRLLSEVFDLYRQGFVRPITPLSIFPISDVESAFRSLQSGKNLGKIAITLGEEDLVKVSNQ